MSNGTRDSRWITVGIPSVLTLQIAIAGMLLSYESRLSTLEAIVGQGIINGKERVETMKDEHRRFDYRLNSLEMEHRKTSEWWLPDESVRAGG